MYYTPFSLPMRTNSAGISIFNHSWSRPAAPTNRDPPHCNMALVLGTKISFPIKVKRAGDLPASDNQCPSNFSPPRKTGKPLRCRAVRPRGVFWRGPAQHAHAGGEFHGCGPPHGGLISAISTVCGHTSPRTSSCTTPSLLPRRI